MGLSSSIKKAVQSIAVMGLILWDASFGPRTRRAGGRGLIRAERRL